jgi:hypothetical protein
MIYHLLAAAAAAGSAQQCSESVMPAGGKMSLVCNEHIRRWNPNHGADTT